MKVAQELKEAQIARQVGFAEAPKHPQIRLEYGEQTLCPVLMHVTARIFLLRMVDKVVRIALQRAIAAGRVGIETTARFDGDIGCFLHRLDRKVPCRLDDASSLAADPGDDRGSVFVVMASTGLAFLAAPPGLATQYLLPAVCRLALVARSMVEIIRFDRAVQLALYLRGQGGIPEPPTPAIAGADMDPQLSGNAARGTRQAQQKGGEKPVCEGALTAVQERAREVIEGALATLLFTPVALQTRLVVIPAPRTDIVTLTSGALQEPIFPPQRMDIGLTRFGVEEFVEMRHNRHS